jgi:DNA-binding NarL/FixJ family response regulator
VRSILIIDDEDLVRAALKRTLALHGYEVSEAPNGKEGLRLYRQIRSDLVLTDLFMPEKEGIETILELRREFPSAKIIAMSGGARAWAVDLLPAAKQLGANLTLSKPFEIDALLSAIEKIIGPPNGAKTEPQTGLSRLR